ncbi:MAG: hypothetical protein ACRDQ7_20715 [Haloechinothrix sp.]
MPFPSLGRFNNRNSPAPDRGRHRDGVPDPIDEGEPDHELESYLAALAPETAAETTDTGRRFGDGQVYQLRLNLIAADQLKQLATEHGTSPLSLAQEWVLERLRWENEHAEHRRRQQNNQPRRPGYPGR